MQVANISLSAAKHQMGLQLRRQSVLECRNSGLTVKEWCAEHQIHPTTYYRWQREVWDHETQALIPDRQGGEISPIRFAEVSVPTVLGSTSSDADIVLKKADWTVEIRNSANSVVLDQVLRMVSSHG